jgi:hypothetical protein
MEGRKSKVQRQGPNEITALGRGAFSLNLIWAISVTLVYDGPGLGRRHTCAQLVEYFGV